MTTNKTPIQELFDALEGILTESARELYLQKEKAFAFDCYSEGERAGGCVDARYNFEQFYAQYAEQHTN